MTPVTTIRTRECRLRRANILIRTIAKRGRQFFRHSATGNIARFEMDARGRLWWITQENARVYLHRPRGARLRGFGDGGTLRALMLALREYIWNGTPLPPSHLGPWPSWYCDGDLWGYGEPAMVRLRRLAEKLGIQPKPNQTAARPRCKP